ncbi:unnamed protein product [Owenia fusiformis]|nr:unnamed protein product [Owenia fusiformis]
MCCSWDEMLIHSQKHKDEAAYDEYRDMLQSVAQMERLNNTEFGLCQICTMIVKNMTSLKAHYQAEHADSAHYPHLLEECEGRITNAVERVKYTREYNVKCQLCKQSTNERTKGFKDYDNLLLHIQAFHKLHPHFQKTWDDIKEKTKKKCEKCKKVLKNKYLLQAHMLTAHPTPESREKSKARCQICKQIFSTKIALASHKRRIHSQGPTVCNECRKIFTCQQDLQTHIKHVHMEPKTVKCNICDKEVRIKNHTRHLRTHAAHLAYSCQFCDKTFAAKLNRDRHENLIHDKSKKTFHICAKCEKKFTSKNSLKQHLKTVHKSSTESNSDEPEQERDQAQEEQPEQQHQLVIMSSTIQQVVEHEEPQSTAHKAETLEFSETESLEAVIQKASGEETEHCVGKVHVEQHRVPTIHEAAMAIKPPNMDLRYTPVPSEILLADIAEEDITDVLGLCEDNDDSDIHV